MTSEDDPFTSYFVVHNADGDYSIWPAVKEIPAGWEAVGAAAARGDCLDWIEANWTGPTLT